MVGVGEFEQFDERAVVDYERDADVESAQILRCRYRVLKRDSGP